MTDDEFRADLLARAASRAEVHAIGIREAFVDETRDRLQEAGELPDAETCSEALAGQRGRRLEIDAFAFDEADESLNLFVAILDGRSGAPTTITLADARDHGFNRLLGVFEQARDGWLDDHIEESRPLWALARRIRTGRRPAALRLHVLTDRMVSERVRDIPGDLTREGVPVSFQIWDLSRLKRIHEAQSVRDDLVVDFTTLPMGGLPVLQAARDLDGYEAYLGVIPGDALADIYIRHGSRLLEGNVRTFLGRRGNINRGIAATLAKEPARFFAYNNGIAATASAVAAREAPGGTLLLTHLTDLQIVNGAQTTASLAELRREGKLKDGTVFVPVKLSVVAPDVAADLIPLISRYANTQNQVKASDFFANHAFHRRLEEISRRILAPAAGDSQVQTHWYYERARGQHLNDQAGLTPARRDQFLRINPRRQVITKTDLAKIESCFEGLPDIACKGAEKAFTSFAERVTLAWKEERKRALLGDDWYRAAVARMLLFRATEALVSTAPWYAGGGERAPIVTYTAARLAALAVERSNGGGLDYRRIWAAQSAGPVLERQLLAIAAAMMRVLRAPPVGGQTITEWAKQQACRKQALETDVPVVEGFDALLVGKEEVRAGCREAREGQEVVDGLAAVTEVLRLGAPWWQALRSFAQSRRLLGSEDAALLGIACAMPSKIPTDWQASRLLRMRLRCEEAGLETDRQPAEVSA